MAEHDEELARMRAERPTVEVPTSFNIETAVEDFEGPGRTVEQVDRGESSGGLSLNRHIYIHVNDWTISATWNWGTYCTGARGPGGGLDLDRDSEPESPDAEVAVWRSSGRYMVELAGGDSVEGWVKPAAVIAAIEAAERDDEHGIRAALVRSED